MNVVPNPRRAYTLIELLVVLTIVGLIIAILLPVFVSARERARQANCASNLRQMAMAFHLYLQDDGGVYPPAITGAKRGGTYVLSGTWEQAVSPYLVSIQVLQCPDLPPVVFAPTVLANQTTVLVDQNRYLSSNYEYDAPWLNLLSHAPDGVNIYRGASEASLQTPTTTYLNSDSWSVDPVTRGFIDVQKVTQTSCGQPFEGRTLHSGGGNYSFADGHAKWLTPQQVAEANCANGPLPASFQGWDFY